MKRNGFTLIELLVVVAIIGILAAVGVVAYNGYTASAKESATRNNYKNIVKMILTNKTKCELDGQDITLVNNSNGKAVHYCNAGVTTVRRAYLDYMLYSGWMNAYNSSTPITYNIYPGKIGLSTKCCINGKEYMEVHSFPKDAKNPEITNIEWE